MRDPRLVNPPPQFRDQLVAPSTLPLSARSATSPPLAAATTYLTSREQHAHPHFDPRAPHPQYDGLRDNRSRHAQAPSPVRWAHPPSRWQDQPPPPPPPVHRVYILRCATCDTFLSDRGMRVSATPELRHASCGGWLTFPVSPCRPCCCSSPISSSFPPMPLPATRAPSGPTQHRRSPRPRGPATASLHHLPAMAVAPLSATTSCSLALAAP